MSPATSSVASVCSAFQMYGKPDPAVRLVLEDPGLDQPSALRWIARVVREGERLGDDCTDGKLEDVVGAVGGMSCRAAA